MRSTTHHLRFFKRQLIKRGYTDNFISKIQRTIKFDTVQTKRNKKVPPWEKSDLPLKILPYNHLLKPDTREKYTVVFRNQRKLSTFFKQ
jgi:hypothetical protein